MTRKGWILLGVGVTVVGLLSTVLVVAALGGSPRGYVRDRYALVSADGDSTTYRSDASAGSVADDIARRWKPADRIVDPSGYYLRYSDDYIAVLPAVGGSVIHVDDARRGYQRWYSVVGGTWGSYSGGPGGGFRGGGPGAGK